VTINRIITSIKGAADAVKAGKIVAYPTETVYGLGALALEKSTVEKVIALKQMTFIKPISLAVSNFSMLETVAFIEDVDVLHQLLPGPITVLLRKTDLVPDILTAGANLVGIRFPSHEIARALIDSVGAPITSTSANITSAQPAQSARDVKINVSCVLDGGKAILGPSSVVDLVNRVVVRRGAGYDILLNKNILCEDDMFDLHAGR
jgi:L-threonylcarbamoyladenylate synthase